MADFAAVVDPDPDRRARFLAEAEKEVHLLDGLEAGEASLERFAVVWAAAPSAPVDVHREAGGVAALWGDALPPSAAEPWGAADILRRWSGPHPEGAPALDGFHAAVTWSDAGELVVGCDLLGLFPVYHWSGGDGVTVVASSPELIRRHPSFRAATSLEGLAGVLLTGGAVEGRTLWQGVRRLAPGHLLRAGAGEGGVELRQYVLPVGGGGVLEPAEAAEALHHRLGRALGRLARRDRRHTLLLSGGRDSRLLAGALGEGGLPFRTFTLGRASDHDARCAAEVARALRAPHALGEVPLERFGALAALHARAEHLMGNASGLYTWGVGDLLDPADEAVVTGHDLELACGGIHLAWAGGEDGPSWAGLRRTVAEHAIAPAVLGPLVRDAALGEAVRETEAWLEARFAEYGDDPETRARGFIWEHWARHHPGAFPWRLSFRAWPVLPVLDQELLALGPRIPAGAAAGRWVQDEVLRRRHPALARLPVVRSSGLHEPIEPGASWPVRRAVGRLLEEASYRLPGLRRPGERRYYRRTYDMDNVGWTRVRRAAEPHRDRLHDLFDADALHDLLPPPDRALGLARPIADGFGRKTLLGLMLWAGRG